MEFPPKKGIKFSKKKESWCQTVLIHISLLSSVKVVRYLDFFSFSKSSLTVVVSLSKKRRRGRASGAFFANVTVDAVLPVRRDDGTPLAEEKRFEEELFLSRRERLTGRRVLSTPPREK